jgi:hypothetical protein
MRPLSRPYSLVETYGPLPKKRDKKKYFSTRSDGGVNMVEVSDVITLITRVKDVACRLAC